VKQKVTEKLSAIKLRKQGKTVNEIAIELGVAKSSVSTWVRNVPLSPQAEKKLREKVTAGQRAGAESNRARTLHARHNHFKAAISLGKESPLDINQKRIVCALLYWCEGAKSDNCVAFTNSDKDLVLLFLTLFRASFAIDESKFRVCVHVHSYHNPPAQIEYWSHATNIPKDQFIKPYQKAHSGKQIHENYQGCVSIRYHSADIARQLLETAKAAFLLYNPN